MGVSFLQGTLIVGNVIHIPEDRDNFILPSHRKGSKVSSTLTTLDQVIGDIETRDELDQHIQNVELDVNDPSYELRMGSTIATIAVKC